LNFVELKENLSNLINIGFWWTLISICNHFSKSYCCLWVYWHNLSQNFGKIRDMSCLLAIWHNFIKLICFNQSLNHFIRWSWLLINLECHLRICLSYKISQFISHCQFLFFNPVFNKVQFVLQDNRFCKLNWFNRIKFSCL